MKKTACCTQNKNSIEGSTFLKTAISVVVFAIIFGLILILIEVNKQSKIRTVITEANRFQAAVMNFKQKYEQLPGDNPKAAAYIPSDTPLTNGDGNRQIEHKKGEGIAAWQHLISSKSIYGYTLKFDEKSTTLIGENIPKSNLGNYGWHFDFAEDADGNHMGFGSHSDEYDLNINPALTPWQASEIDQRLDDGHKNSGKVRGFSTEGYNCGKTNYDLENDTIQCMVTIKVLAQ